MVAADEGSFDPGEEEDDDLPTTVLTDELQSDHNIEISRPIFWKCSQNCSQNFKSQLKSPQHMSPSTFEC